MTDIEPLQLYATAHELDMDMSRLNLERPNSMKLKSSKTHWR